MTYHHLFEYKMIDTIGKNKKLVVRWLFGLVECIVRLFTVLIVGKLYRWKIVISYEVNDSSTVRPLNVT